MKTVAQLIDDLFYTHRKENGREYSHKEVCDALGDVAPSHLSRLRSGKITNPGRDVLLSLCRFFKVPPSYFFPELESMSEDEQSGVSLGMLLRSSGVDPHVAQKLEELAAALTSKKTRE